MEVYHIPLTRGLIAQVSLEDADQAHHHWRADDRGYPVRLAYPISYRRVVRLHRVIVERMLGRALQPGEEVDHKDGDLTNNTRANLRVCSHAQNMLNKKQHKNNRSGHTGVWLDKETQQWRAEIRKGGHKYCLGRYWTLEEAAEARRQAVEQYFGEWARK